MRIAFANWTCRRAGGVETYLDSVIPELAKLGHEIGFFSELDEPSQRARITISENSKTWCIAKDGTDESMSGLRAWQPDIIYCHKLNDPDLERQLIDLAPSVSFAHDYDGTCVSGSKTFKFPVVRVCDRTFGWKCLMHYFPHRCGGLNPVTMLKLYSDQSKRLENRKAYHAIVTHSDYMIAELQKLGLTAQRAFKNGNGAELMTGNRPNSASREIEKSEFTLLFSGRLEYLKGVHLLIDALPETAKALGAPVHAVIAGDGRERVSLERQAARIRNAQIQIEFVGWMVRPQLEVRFEECDLLVVPSLWPEPFGLIGPEAGMFGLPVAAFDVGGIRDWLSDGVNGFLAPANPANAKGLAEAIVKCLRDRTTHARLRTGAAALAERFSMQNHLAALCELFSNVRARHSGA